MEFGHVVVLAGGWDRVGRDEDVDAPRRLYYVAMTRARQTLTLAQFFRGSAIPGSLFRPAIGAALQATPQPSSGTTGTDPSVSAAQPARHLSELSRVQALRSSGSPRHCLRSRPEIRWICGPVQSVGSSWIATVSVVGQLASNFAPPDGMHCTSATVLAIVTWDKEKSEPQFQGNFRCENWEVVVPELVFEPERQSAN